MRRVVAAQLRCSRLAENPAPESSADAGEILEPRRRARFFRREMLEEFG